MAGFSDFFENKVLDFIWGAQSFTMSGTVYVGLSTATITDATTGITVTEPPTSNTAYARVSVTNNLSNFPAATVGTKQNANAVNFPTATGNWGNCTDFFFSDGAAVGVGSVIAFGVLTTPKTISSGDSASFATNAITITLD